MIKKLYKYTQKNKLIPLLNAVFNNNSIIDLKRIEFNKKSNSILIEYYVDYTVQVAFYSVEFGYIYSRLKKILKSVNIIDDIEF